MALWAALQRPQQPLSAARLLEELRRKRDSGLAPRSGAARVALGFNACLDTVVDALALLEACGLDREAGDGDLRRSTEVIEGTFKVARIRSLADLDQVFLYHFQHSAAGERSVEDGQTFALLEQGLKEMSGKSKTLLGGNAAIMAQVLAEDWGFKHVTLAGQIGREIERLLPRSIAKLGLEAGKEVSGIPVRNDEVHIIMEYENGAEWRGAKSERANRFIVSRDLSNAILASLEPLTDTIEKGEIFDLIVAAGLHMLDIMESDYRQHRVQEIVENFRKVPKETRIHFELASIGEDSLVHLLAEKVLPEVDSLGLNEQEIGSLYEALGLKDANLSAVIRRLPDVAEVCKIIASVLKHESNRRLARIHFHSFSYHLIAQKVGSKEWPNIAQAVAAGSVKASERACGRANLSETDVTLQLNASVVFDDKFEPLILGHDNAVLEFTDEKSRIHFALAPVLTCNNPVQTVGLGDSISASALAFQV